MCVIEDAGKNIHDLVLYTLSAYSKHVMSRNFSELKTLWRPERPVSRGAKAYHDAVTHASWHVDNIVHLIGITKPNVRPGHIVVDFGAGTGSSAVYFRRHLPKETKLVLVDNSASWLGHAYELLAQHPDVACVLLKDGDRYLFLDEVIGEVATDHVFCANTIHLMSNLRETLEGIRRALKRRGTFAFQSGNIRRKARKNGVLMIHNTVDRVHDLAIAMIKKEKRYAAYHKDLTSRIEREYAQRKFVFPDPKPIEYYQDLLTTTGFKNLRIAYKPIRVRNRDWLTFLRVRRLQAGILPEVGGKDATPEEEHDRDALIAAASKELFSELASTNPFADRTSFAAEWVYVTVKK